MLVLCRQSDFSFGPHGIVFQFGQRTIDIVSGIQRDYYIEGDTKMALIVRMTSTNTFSCMEIIVFDSNFTGISSNDPVNNTSALVYINVAYLTPSHYMNQWWTFLKEAHMQHSDRMSWCAILIEIERFSIKKMHLKSHLQNGGHLRWAHRQLK